MIRTLKELQGILDNTALKDCRSAKVPVLDTGEVALALQIHSSILESAWRVARTLLPATGRWPLVTTTWSGKSGTLEQLLEQGDLFSRFYFEEAPNAGDVSPRALIAASAQVDIKQFLLQLRADNEAEEVIDDLLEAELFLTREACQRVPTMREIKQARMDGGPIHTRYQLDRWLLEWEMAQGCAQDPAQGRQDWYQPDTAILLFLPTASSWESLAYLSFYGAYAGAEKYIALGKSWEQRFGAELVTHYGTMLQCRVTRPPQDLRTAWALSMEHDLFAPCTMALPGIALRQYAAGLVNHPRWFLHERP